LIIASPVTNRAIPTPVIAACGGLLLRVFGLPDATVSVLQGMLFVVLIASDSLYGRVRWGGAKGTS
jgi:simple sugar transport system permease protein